MHAGLRQAKKELDSAKGRLETAEKLNSDDTVLTPLRNDVVLKQISLKSYEKTIADIDVRMKAQNMYDPADTNPASGEAAMSERDRRRNLDGQRSAVRARITLITEKLTDLKQDPEKNKVQIDELTRRQKDLQADLGSLSEERAKPARQRAPEPEAPRHPRSPETGLNRRQQEEMHAFIKKHIGIVMQIAALGAEDTRLDDLDRTDERKDQLYTQLLARLPKELRPTPGSSDETAIRKEVASYIRVYRENVEQLKGKFDIPKTKEGQENLLRSFVEQYAANPEKAIETNDPLVAILQAEFRKNPRVAALPRFPRGSGAFARAEQAGVGVVLEDAAGWVETSVISAGFMMALHTYLPLVGLEYVLSMIAAITLSYGSNIPVKNIALKKVMETGNVVEAYRQTVLENPIKSSVLMGVVLAAIAPALDSAIKEGLTSQKVATEIEKSLKPAEAALQNSASEFPRFIATLESQLNALVTAEGHPEKISAFQQEFPGMTFGASGNAGEGPIYHAKERLFFGKSTAENVSSSTEALRIVKEARAQAGLEGNQSLPQELTELYTEFLSETEPRRDRITALLAEVHGIDETMMKQDINYLLLHTGVLGKAPVSPSEVIPARAELEKLLIEQGEAYAAMRATAKKKIDILAEASKKLLPGSELSLTFPEFSLLKSFQDFIHVELSPEHPLIHEFSLKIASVLHQEELMHLSPEQKQKKLEELAPQYLQQADVLVKSIGITFSFTATFLLLGLRTFGSLRRARRIREQQEFHLKEAKEGEEAVIDDLHVFVNGTLRKFYPAYPEVTRVRVRMAVREFMSRKVVELGGNPETQERIKHWIFSNFAERGQNSEDTEALAGVKKMLASLQDDPKQVAELLETLFPGYKNLSESLGHDLEAMQKVAQGAPLSSAEIEEFKTRFENPQRFAERVNTLRMEATYAALDRKLADLDLQYTAFEHILADVKVGADTYGVFTEGDTTSAEENRGVTSIINTKRYIWRKNRKDGSIGAPDISERDQQVMRRVAEETEAAKVIIRLMRENRTDREETLTARGELDQAFVTRQIKEGKAQAIKVPASVFEGRAKTVRDRLNAGAGMFQDVAQDVRSKLQGIPREELNKAAEYSVSDQLNAMAEKLLSSEAFKSFIYNLNVGRSASEKLTVGLGVIYGPKVEKSVSESSIDVPGFALRLRIVDKNKREVGNEDFQMSHVLLTNKSPAIAADIFQRWTGGACNRLEAKFKKQWLTEHFISGDAQKAQEGIFRSSGSQERDEAWLDNFYTRTLLAWKRAEVARGLVEKRSISEREMAFFIEPKPAFVYNDVPSKAEMKRVLNVFYEQRESRGFFDTLRSVNVRAKGLVVDLNNWSVVQSSQNKKKERIPVTEYGVKSF